MSKNLIKILETLGIENAEETATKLLSDDENLELVDDLLKSAQAYSQPFIEATLKENFNAQKDELKGQYFKDAARQYYKKYPIITNKELDELFKDGGFAAVVEAIDERRDKPAGDEAEVKKLLDAANAKIEELQQTVEQVSIEAEQKASKKIKEFQTENVLTTKVAELLKTKTNKPSLAQAKLFIKATQGERAVFDIDDNGELRILDPKNPENVLKNGDTKLMTLESLVDSYVDEYGLKPAAPPQEPPIPGGGAGVPESDKIISNADYLKNLMAKRT